VGMLLGSFIFGMISDQFGRLKAVILSIFVTAVSGALGALVCNPVIFAILRITCGMGGIGCYMVSYVIAAETTLPSYKIITTTLVGIGFSFIYNWFIELLTLPFTLHSHPVLGYFKPKKCTLRI
jgi:OCT family organic cation transporter-like MFS transporter 4/5